MPLVESEYAAYEKGILNSVGKAQDRLSFTNDQYARFCSFKESYGDRPWPAQDADFAKLKCLQIAAQASEELHNAYIRLKQTMVHHQLIGQSSQSLSSQTSVLAIVKRIGLGQLPSDAISTLVDAVSHSIYLDTGNRPTVVNNTDASIAASTDCMINTSQVDEAEATLKAQCYTVLTKQPGLVQTKVSEPRSRATAPVPKFTNTIDESYDNSEERLRFGDLLDNMDGAEDLDMDDMQEVKIKAGILVSQWDRKKKRKRKRDDMGGRIYTDVDREDMNKALRQAMKKLGK